jgi:predicted nucleotidyltransferase
MRAQSPIKVHESTKEKVRYAALMAGLKQAELVERAVDEYVERHREQFAQRMERAHEALLGGKTSTLADSLDLRPADVERVGRVRTDQLGGSRRPRRATSNHASSATTQSDLRRVRAQRQQILRCAATHGACNVRVFGSTVRGESGASSDIDLLVEMEPGRTLLDLVGLWQDLEDLLDVHVDVLSDGGVSPHLRERIYAEAVPL